MAPVKHETALDKALGALLDGSNRDPFAVLGPHLGEYGSGTIVRVFQPAARSIELRLVASRELRPMVKRDPVGFPGVYEIVVGREDAAGSGHPDYRLRITFPGNHVLELDDPYRYGRVLTDFDLHLFGEGTHR